MKTIFICTLPRTGSSLLAADMELDSDVLQRIDEITQCHPYPLG